MTPVFFTDRDLGKKFPEILRSAGLVVEQHHLHFRHDTPDDIWLAEIGARGWYALTHNSRIRYTPNELAAVVNHGVGLFVLVGKARFVELAANFVATYNQVLTFLDTHKRPFIARVYRPSPSDPGIVGVRPGRVTLWLDASGSLG